MKNTQDFTEHSVFEPPVQYLFFNRQNNQGSIGVYITYIMYKTDQIFRHATIFSSLAHALNWFTTIESN